MTGGILVFAVIIGLIPALIARHKGSSFWFFWVLGALLFIVALPWALLMKDTRPRCPECREIVHAEASRCPHCQSEIGGRVIAPAPSI